MKRVRVSREWMLKHPWLARVFLILNLPLVPLVCCVMVIKDNYKDIIDPTVETAAGAFLPWEP